MESFSWTIAQFRKSIDRACTKFLHGDAKLVSRVKPDVSNKGVIFDKRLLIEAKRTSADANIVGPLDKWCEANEQSSSKAGTSLFGGKL